MLRVLTVFFLFSLPLRVWADGEASALAAVAADRVYDFLLRSRPSSMGAIPFFEALGENEALRARYEQVIAQDPRLQKAAEQGLEFRQTYLRFLDEGFSGDRFLKELSTYPADSVWRSFEVYRLSQRSSEDIPIRPEQARIRALTNTQAKFGLAIDEDQMAAQYPGVFDFFKRELWQREMDVERRSLPPPKLDARRVGAWKKMILRRIQDSRLEMAKHGLKLLIEKEGSVSFHSAGSNAAGPSRMRGGDFEKASFKIVPREKDRPADSLISSNLDSSLRTSIKVLGQVSSLVPLIPNEVMRGRLDPVQARGAKFFGPRWGFGNGELVEIRWNEATGRGRRKKETSHRFIVPIEDLHSVAATRGITALEQRGTLREWAGKDPVHSYLWSMASRDQEMQDMEDFLKSSENEDGQAFSARLQKRHPRKERVGGVLGPRMPETRVSRSDLVAGLEWQGYAQHPDHWNFRDQVAKEDSLAYVFSPEKGRNRTAPEQRHFRRGLADKLSKLGQWKRSVALWTALAAGTVGTVGAGYGVWKFLEHLPNPVSGSGSETGQGGRAAIKIGDPPKAWNKPLDGHGTGEHVYHLLPGPGGNGDLPKYYDLIGRDATGLRYSESEQVEIHRASRPAAFTLKSVAPHFKGDLDEVALPSVEGHEPVRTKLTDKAGNVLSFGTDYGLRRDSLSKEYFFELHAFDRWDKDEEFQIQVEYGKAASPSPAQYGIFDRLDLERLGMLAAQMDAAGLRRDAKNIQQAIRESKKSGSGISVEDLAQIFRKSADYDSAPEGKSLDPGDYVNGFSAFAHFVKNGKRHSQCDGSNQVFQLFLTHYFENNSNVSVIPQFTFSKKDGQAVIVVGDGHLRTVVATRDGVHHRVLDATSAVPYFDPDAARISSPPAPKFDAYVDRRRTRPKWLIELIEGADPKLPEPEKGQEEDHEKTKEPVVTKGVPEGYVTPEAHAQRQKHLEALKRSLLDADSFRELPRQVHNRVQPVQKALRLGTVLADLGAGKLVFTDAVRKLHRLYPGSFDPAKIDSPTRLNDALRAAADHTQAVLNRFADKVSRGEMVSHGVLNNEEILGPTRDLLRFYANTNWSPVWEGGPHPEQGPAVAAPHSVRAQARRPAMAGVESCARWLGALRGTPPREP